MHQVPVNFGMIEGAPVVISVSPGTEAARSDILPGDELIAVDGKPVPWESAGELEIALAGAKNSKVHLHASWSNRAALYKVRDQDRADSSRSINSALSTDGSGGWPSVSTVKSFGRYLYAKKSISASQMNTYRNNGIRVILWTGNDHEDY